MIKTFRGKIANAATDTIVLHTNDGSTGYKIVKFDVIGPDGSENIESVVQIWKTDPGSASFSIDFSNQALLGVAVITQSSSSQIYPNDVSVIFDKEIFNQDIYITCKGVDYTATVNYYLELEQVKLDMGENTVATLKDIRNVTTP